MRCESQLDATFRESSHVDVRTDMDRERARCWVGAPVSADPPWRPSAPDGPFPEFHIFRGGCVATVDERPVRNHLPLAWRKGLIGELWAEFLGVFIIIS